MLEWHPATTVCWCKASGALLLRAKRPDEVLDMVIKRNLVFISWRAGEETGTWVLAFDRNGRVLSWTELS